MLWNILFFAGEKVIEYTLDKQGNKIANKVDKVLNKIDPNLNTTEIRKIKKDKDTNTNWLEARQHLTDAITSYALFVEAIKKIVQSTNNKLDDKVLKLLQAPLRLLSKIKSIF
jgi:DNA-binding ferritin-like protein